MGMTTGSVAQEIQQILNNGVNPVHFHWTGTLLANGLKIQITKITNIDIERDYRKQYTDHISVDCEIPMGTYLSKIFPYKENLLMTLIKTPVEETGSAIAASQDIENHQMRATIKNANDHQLEGNTPAIQDESTANLTALKTVTFQLLDPAVEQIRMMSVGTVMRSTTPGDAIKFFLTSISQKAKVDATSQIKGVDMVSPDNTQVRDHVILPHGLEFSQVPDWIHRHMGGVYNGGFGYYLQNSIWYVYPQYNINRWQSTPKNLTLINIPKNQMPGADRTYRKTNNQLIVLLTGENKHSDDTEGLQLNHGNGLRFTDSAKIMEGFGITKNNKYTVNRSANNTEFVSNPRATGLNNIQMSRMRITNNQFFESGKVARTLGGHMVVTWEHSEPGALYPGMPVKYVYIANNKVTEVYGVLLGVHHYIGMTSGKLTGGHFVCNSALTLFLDNGNQDSATQKPTTATTTGTSG
jgi:hypothetical protein